MLSSRNQDINCMALEIRIRGIVQGVGFRPFVYRLAKGLDLRGNISNTTSGVVIRIAGQKENVAMFVQKIREEAPPLSRIHGMETENLLTEGPLPEGFEISGTLSHGRVSTLISPDIAVCRDCLAEIMDRDDRRFGYAFTNCTNCGPRYTIIESLPYDRENTSMKAFRMCKSCLEEYQSPMDRRFHAQPNACPECGPGLYWLAGGKIARDDPIGKAAAFLQAGKIVAIKGLGGFHIAADAFEDVPVNTLRTRKQRPFKPFAVMVDGIETARELCHLSDKEANILMSPEAPIVVVPAREDSVLSAKIAPGIGKIGVMLPYTPLHHLLFARKACPRALIMTSGNPRGEPLCTGNHEALERLDNYVDGFLLHNRDIYTGVDDSVVRIMAGKPRFIRRSRGFAPAPVKAVGVSHPGLAVGAELKNTFCLCRKDEAFPSQHIGNLSSLACLEFFQENIAHMKRLLEITPEFIAADLHPDYLSTSYAVETGLPVFRIQHHFAHAASVMAEHGIREEVLALVLDGSGFGPDNTVWGGEVLSCTPAGFQRLARLRPFPLPGGDMAAREPWRMALSLLFSMGVTDSHAVPMLPGQAIDPQKQQNILEIMRLGLGSPMTSSCGRLFDGVAALADVCIKNTYEGQSAMMLEHCCQKALRGKNIVDTTEFEDFLHDRACWSQGEMPPYEIDWRQCVETIRRYLKEGRSKEAISTVFHAFLTASFSSLLIELASLKGISKLVLSGGCMQNRVLLEGLTSYLNAKGLQVYVNECVPANDAGISLGQALAGSALYEAAVCA